MLLYYALAAFGYLVIMFIAVVLVDLLGYEENEALAWFWPVGLVVLIGWCFIMMILELKNRTVAKIQKMMEPKPASENLTNPYR